MTLDQIIRSRRSIRSYKDTPVSEEQLTAILEAGRLAPSARNLQTWRFTVVRDAALRQKLVAACNGQEMVGQAPVVLVMWATDERMMPNDQSAASQDCSIALSFMVLKATELGLGTCWMGAFSSDAVRDVLDLPAGVRVVAVSPLGVPNEAPAPRPRKDLAEIIDYK